MPTFWATTGFTTLTIVVSLLVLWRLVTAFEQISLSLAQIAYKTKDEADS